MAFKHNGLRGRFKNCKRLGSVPEGSRVQAARHSKGLFSRNTEGKAETDRERANGAEEVLGVQVGGGWGCLRSKQEFVASVLVQRQVHHFGRRHPGGLRGNSSPELRLVCAVQLLHRRVLPGGQALYHAAARMCTPAGEEMEQWIDWVSAKYCKTALSTAADLFSLWPTVHLLLFSCYCGENFKLSCAIWIMSIPLSFYYILLTCQQITQTEHRLVST